MSIKKGLPIKRLRGDKLLIKRNAYPESTSAGIILPDSYIKSKEDVNVTHELPKYQNCGEVIGIGDEVTEGVYELGDIVHFQPNSYLPAIFDKEDISIITSKSMFLDIAEVIVPGLLIDWIEN